MSDSLKIIETKPKWVITVKQVVSKQGEYYIYKGDKIKIEEHIKYSFLGLMQYLKKVNGGFPKGGGFIKYNKKDGKDLHIEIGYPTEGTVPENENINSYKMLGNKYAVHQFKGLFSKIPEAHEKLSKWIQENQLTTSGELIEVYLIIPIRIPEDFPMSPSLRWGFQLLQDIYTVEIQRSIE